MMHGRGKSDSAIVVMKPANKAEPPTAESSAVMIAAAEPVERRAGTKGNADWQSTYWTQRQGSVSQALERIRQVFAVRTRGRSRMRESCTYGSVRGALSNERPYRNIAVMQRRSFLTLLGTSAAAWPLAARAQQDWRVRRVGLLLSATADDAESQVWVGAFLQGLALLGWTLGRNVRIETRWAGGNVADIRNHAAELVALAPDLIVAHGTSSAAPLLQVTRTVPVVFVSAADPVGAGLVKLGAPPAVMPLVSWRTNTV